MGSGVIGLGAFRPGVIRGAVLKIPGVPNRQSNEPREPNQVVAILKNTRIVVAE